MIDHAI
jgi:hypothetical protein